ncbi:restriction endonuclease [Acidithiobacillus sp. MC6.1]|nr:restriction endonuclease [Acidithiobacillus sp. MC6.1]
MSLHHLWQRFRERFLPASHRRNIASARRAIPKLRQLAIQSPARCFGYLRHMDPLVFEELVLELYLLQGFRIRRGTRYSGDGGIDGWVKVPPSQNASPVWTPIQCKRYASAINPQHVADFSDLLSRHKKHFGLFVHTGRTGERSRAHAQGSVRFVSGDRLLQLLKGSK